MKGRVKHTQFLAMLSLVSVILHVNSYFSLGYFLTHKYNANWTTAYWMQCLQQAKNLASLQFLFLIVFFRLGGVWRAWHPSRSLKIKQGLYILAWPFNNNLSLGNDSWKAGMAKLLCATTCRSLAIFIVATVFFLSFSEYFLLTQLTFHTLGIFCFPGEHVCIWTIGYLSLFDGATKNSVLFAFFSSGARWNWVQERFPLAARLLHAPGSSVKSNCKGVSNSEIAFTRYQENEISFASVGWRVYKSIEINR